MKKILIMVMIFALPCVVVSAEEKIPQQFEGFNLEGYNETGEVAWDVTGDTADVNGNLIEISNVDANHYGGEQEVNITAKTGKIDKDTGAIRLIKDVVITTKTQGQLKTDTLDWNKEEDLVTTEDFVVITDKAMTATGTGLRARPGLKRAQMNEDVKVRVDTEPTKPDGKVVTITCDGPMEIDQFSNMAVFHDNVIAVQDDRILKADRMEVHFNAESKRIEQTVCIGNVVIIQGENQTHSEKAIYNALSKKLVLSGRPKMIMVTEEGSGMASFK